MRKHKRYIKHLRHKKKYYVSQSSLLSYCSLDLMRLRERCLNACNLETSKNEIEKISLDIKNILTKLQSLVHFKELTPLTDNLTEECQFLIKLLENIKNLQSPHFRLFEILSIWGGVIAAVYFFLHYYGELNPLVIPLVIEVTQVNSTVLAIKVLVAWGLYQAFRYWMGWGPGY